MIETKGFVSFFLNINEHNQHISIEEYIELIRKQNAASIELLSKDGYLSIFIPCFNEACRVEKTDIANRENEDNEEG